jgi:hypothetical protein
MMFRASARRIAVAGALAPAVSGPSASMAFAGSDERIDVKYGYAKFEAHGDKLTAGDIWKDGYGVQRLGWENSKGPRTASIINTSTGCSAGSRTCRTSS